MTECLQFAALVGDFITCPYVRGTFGIAHQLGFNANHTERK